MLSRYVPPNFLCDPKKSEKVIVRQSSVRGLVHFHSTLISNAIHVQLAASIVTILVRVALIFTEISGSDNDHANPKLYDWILILPQEIKFMWRASWNWTKVLYLLTRYIPFASMAFMARSEFPPSP